jgi:hypothetical protein
MLSAMILLLVHSARTDLTGHDERQTIDCANGHPLS